MKKAYEKPEIKIYRECNYCAVCEAYVPCGAALCPCCYPEEREAPAVATGNSPEKKTCLNGINPEANKKRR